MLDWGIRFAVAGVIACCLATLIGCGVSSSSVSITPASVTLIPGQSFQFGAIRTGNAANASQLVFLVNGVAGGSLTAGTITSGGLYTAPSTASGQSMTIGVQGQASTAAVTLLNPSSFPSGSVAATQNPLVASYSIVAPAGASVQVQFGPDTGYGLSTSAVQPPANGGNVTVLVAGMRAGTTYHMQAVIDLTNGSQALDADHTFTTGSIPADRVPNITGEGTPSDGVELFSLIPYGNQPQNVLTTVATDLEGNVIWYYDVGIGNATFPVKLLPNGHMMILTSPSSSAVAVPPPTFVTEILEVDLAGNIVNQLKDSSVRTPNSASFHHDFAVLPNGHWMLLSHYAETINNVAGIPPGTEMTGDELIEWDPEKQVVDWTWSAFDHLDLTHAPYGFADWTHANAIVYSPDDGNLILSLRNQNWIIKINYDNGAGDGSILWHLGPGGDFSLPGLEAPIDWNYGQHYPTIVSPNSAGVFSLMFFNNGNNRFMNSSNEVCGSPGVGPCYSSVPIIQLDESQKAATVMWQFNLLPAYSICCGDALILPNGNTEFDIAFDEYTPGLSTIEEVTPAQDLLWTMTVQDQLAYRGFRIPSLYPGQVWPAATAQSSRRHGLPAAARTHRAEEPRTSIDQLP